MYTIEQAYHTMGITAEDGKEELEKRYRLLVRRMRAGEIRGSTSCMEEARMMAVNRAYRFILDDELKKNSEAFRCRRYGKYKQFAELAERIDHFLFYYKPHLIGLLLLIGFVMVVITVYASLQRDKSAIAASSESSLKIMIAGDYPPAETDRLTADMPRQLSIMFPDLQPVDIRIIGSNDQTPLALYTEIPDLYIVNQTDFIRLLTMGYLSKLDEWDTFGIDLADGPLADLVPAGNKPFIGAVSANAERRDMAIRLIRRMMPPPKTLSTTPTEVESSSSS